MPAPEQLAMKATHYGGLQRRSTSTRGNAHTRHGRSASAEDRTISASNNYPRELQPEICNRLAICRNRREILPTVSFIRCETSFLHWKGNGVATKLWRKAPFGNSGTMNWGKTVPGK